ncbi:MAG: PH domain-containing protein, partial [Candidatus Puniceispirillaceae bacterium]
LYPLAWEKNDLPMKFIKSTLPDNETIEMEIAFHWTHSLIAWLALFFLGWLIVGIFIFISMYIEKWTTERALTNKRLVIKRGLISRQTEEMSFNRIEEVNLNQSILQRLLGSGNIRVTGTGSGEVVMKNIDDPLAVQKKLNEVRQYL